MPAPANNFAASNGPARQGQDGRSMVLGATDIVQLIGQTVSLKRVGTRYVGLCPFHNEKSPSFSVDGQKQFFYCFGCKAAGNAIDFVIKRDRVEFKEALTSLAEAANIELPRFGGGGKEKASERQALLEVCSAAASVFQQNLASDHAPAGAARDYLASRGFHAETIQRFQIGFAFDTWDGLLKHPAMRKFPPQLLLTAGLVKQRVGYRDGNGGAVGGGYDTFRDRIIFPIRDENGRVIAFGGRITPEGKAAAEAKEVSIAKYLNSPETPLFSKSKVAYGLDMGRQRIVETRTVAVVEGYTDVVMAHQVGASNVVSPLGTALTESHVQVLRRFADKIVLIFDGDSAGDAAVNRVVELFLTQPVEIAIASMPEGLDPDEFLANHGTDGFDKLLASAQDALTYLWKRLNARFKTSESNLTGSTRAIEEYMAVLAQARQGGPVDSLRWHRTLADLEKKSGVPASELNKRFGAAPKTAPRRFEQNEPQPSAPAPPPAVPRGPATGRQRAEKWLMGVLLNEPNRWNAVQRDLSPEEIADPLLRTLATIFWDHQRDEGEPVLQDFVASLPTGELKALAIELAGDVETLADVERAMSDTLAFLRNEKQRQHHSKQIAALRRNDSGPADAESEIAFLKAQQERARSQAGRKT